MSKLSSWQNGEIWAGSADAQDATVTRPRRQNPYYLNGWRTGAVTAARKDLAKALS